jgi:RimJ/RimL family protein N-acetyltransferase
MIKKIKPHDTSDLENLSIFLKENIQGKKTFRYFDKRNFDSLNNHLVTLLCYYNSECIGYGHLDNENENVWLGIFVADEFKGLGFGGKIMTELLKEYNGEIRLSVDKDNWSAIKLYEKFGFTIQEDKLNYYLMKRDKIWQIH